MYDNYFSTLKHSGSDDRQPSQSAPQSFNNNRQIYHDLSTNGSMIRNENDVGLSDVIKNAVGQLKNSRHSRLNVDQGLPQLKCPSINILVEFAKKC